MVSKVHQVAEIDAQIRELQKKREAIVNSPEFATENEFAEKLKGLLTSYGMGLKDVMRIIEPAGTSEQKAERGDKRRNRAVKTYKNPNTGEVVETKGGNNKTLKAWKEQWGVDVVKGWVQ